MTQETSYRRGTEMKLKAIVDEAVEQCPTVKNVVVYRGPDTAVKMERGAGYLVA